MRLIERLSDVVRSAFAATGGVLPVSGLGVLRIDAADQIDLVYSDRLGTSAHRFPAAGVPDAFISGGSLRSLTAGEVETAPSGVMPSRLLYVGMPISLRRLSEAQQIITLPVPQHGAERVQLILSLRGSVVNDSSRASAIAAIALQVGAAIDAPQSDVDERGVLRRLDSVDSGLPALFDVSDARAILDRLPTVMRGALRHDLLSLGLLSDDLHTIEVLMQTPHRSSHAWEGPLPFPPELTSTLLYRFVDDVAGHPAESERRIAEAGGRTSLRAAIRRGTGIIGMLNVTSFDPVPYTAADLAVARKIADSVALALSHQRLAAEVRRVAARQERDASLDLLDGLMNAITGVLDVRDAFDQIFEISQPALAYDAMSIAVPTADGTRVTLYATTGALRGAPTPVEYPLGDPSVVERNWEFLLVDDCLADSRYAWLPSVKAGMRSLLMIPVRLDQELRAWVNFWSVSPGRFTNDDVPIARRIAAHITLALSHQRLAEQTQRAEELRARTTSVELLDELLAALTDAGDIPDVFGRISDIARKVLRHDAAVLMVRLADGLHARVYASAGFPGKLPDTTEVPDELLADPDWEYHVYDDLSTRGPRYERAKAFGLHSMLRVPIRLDGTFAGALVFFSSQLAGFRQTDVLVARRMADRLALTLVRDREVQASRRADEASARAAKLEARVNALTEELDARTGYRRVVGDSRSWRTVLTQATQVAATDTTVLLLGESGTGKEVVARFLHRASSRANGPFIALNCAALPEQLLEAELFGYERGAYTGATQSKPGQLEQAAGGTLFLDEVGEMSLPAQAKFLRVLQEREFQRLGGTRVLRTDARIVAATNRDLPKAITHGQFREDLYYRLNVFAIALPPLRERREDILPLSEAFLADIGRGIGRPPGGISREARKLLVQYHWPGNVRELRNILERAAILCEGGLITVEYLALTEPPPPPAPHPQVAGGALAAAPASLAPPASNDELQSIERGMIEQALQSARFNKSKAAKALGLTRQQLYVRMRKYDLE